jgi:hypothetical protein
VSEKSEKSEESEKLVVVDTFDYFPQASTAKAMLENQGIAVVLTDAEMANTNLLWAGAVGGIKLVVPESQVEAATAILKEMRRVARQRSSVDDSVPLDASCPSCAAPLPETGTVCTKCGWSFAGEEVRDYENGPVPDALLSFVYRPLDSQRFALPIDKVPEYLDWCEKNGVEVTGWEFWERGLPGHTPLTSAEGDAGALRAALVKFDRENFAGIFVCVATRPQDPPHNED